MEHYSLMILGAQFSKIKSSGEKGWLWLHDNMNVLNITELYI